MTAGGRFKDRKKAALRRAVLPFCSARLDRWLLLAAPRLWRSRLLPILWLSLAGAAFAWFCGLVSATEMTSRNAWTRLEFASVMTAWAYLTCIGVALWWRWTSAHASVDATRWQRLRAAAFNLVAVAVIALPMHVYHAMVARSIASTVPDLQLREDLKAIDRWMLGRCDAIELSPEDRATATALAQRFGVGIVTDADAKCNPVDRQLLVDRAESIASLKAAWTDPGMAAWLTPLARLNWSSLIVFGAPLLLLAVPGLAGRMTSRLGHRYEHSALLQRLGRNGIARRLRAIDHWLLVRHPIVWSSRVGSSIVAIACLTLPAWLSMRWVLQDLWSFAWLAFLIVMTPLVVASSRRRHAPPVLDFAASRRLAGCDLLLAAIPPTLYASAMASLLPAAIGAQKVILFSWFGAICLGLAVTLARSISLFRDSAIPGSPWVSLMCFVQLVVFGLSLENNRIHLATISTVPIAYLATALLVRLRLRKERPAGLGWKRLAALNIATLPAVCIACFLVAADRFDGSHATELVLAMACAVVLPFATCLPWSLLLLSRARAAPANG